IRAHNPASVHRRNHRCAVGTFTPNDGGTHRQAHPLVSTYTIAVNTLRASAGARPPPCGRSPACGISGSTSSQSSSGTNRCDNASTTDDDLALNTDQDPNETRSNEAVDGSRPSVATGNRLGVSVETGVPVGRLVPGVV